MTTYLLVRQMKERHISFESLDGLEGAVAMEEDPNRLVVSLDVRDDLPILQLGRPVFNEKLGNRRSFGRGCVRGWRRKRTAVLTCRGGDGRRGQLADGESGSESRVFMPAGDVQPG